jgi:hypothetical protein
LTVLAPGQPFDRHRPELPRQGGDYLAKGGGPLGGLAMYSPLRRNR